MKNLSKVVIVFFVGLLLTGLFTSCQKENGEINDDTHLIQAIQEATNKQIVSADELPSPSLIVLEQDYSESYIDDAKIAPELGYEVSMRREKGTCIGECSQAYFNLNGRELKSESGDRYKDKDRDKDRDGRDRKECFDFVYPVSFTMPDGSTITGNDEEDLCTGIRSWYEANPDSKVKPELQYPVEYWVLVNIIPVISITDKTNSSFI
ncbi:MAG: hypothetical protein IMY71_03015 [Bacteroidetes bacterium]|nr:hypothetical protein [Bacteroidota bacterium]